MIRSQTGFAIGTAVVLSLAGCASAPTDAARDYDLAFTHPAPFATYLRVSPASAGAALPPPDHMVSRAFSDQMRRQTGCAVNPAYPISVLGPKSAPLGYMVPVTC